MSGAVCVHVQEFVVLCGDFVVTPDVRLDFIGVPCGALLVSDYDPGVIRRAANLARAANRV